MKCWQPTATIGASDRTNNPTFPLPASARKCVSRVTYRSCWWHKSALLAHATHTVTNPPNRLIDFSACTRTRAASKPAAGSTTFEYACGAHGVHFMCPLATLCEINLHAYATAERSLAHCGLLAIATAAATKATLHCSAVQNDTSVVVVVY